MEANAATPWGADDTAKGRLMTAALELFNRSGYAATTVREIVELAGVTKPVLYYHFRSKEGIYLAILEDALAALRTKIIEVGRGEGSIRERIYRLSEEFFAMCTKNVAVARLIHAAYYGPQQGAPAFDFDAYHHAFVDVLQELVEAGMRNGELREGEPVLTAMALHCASHGAVEAMLAHPELGIGCEVVRQLLDRLFEGVAAQNDRERGQ